MEIQILMIITSVDLMSAAALSPTTTAIKFILDVVPTPEPQPWLRKQELIKDDKPTVGGVVLFAE